MIKKHFRLLVVIALIAVGLIAISSVFAGDGFSWNRVESLIANKMFTKIEGGVNVLDTPEETFGASASTLNMWTDQSGLVTYVMSGSFLDATTTIVSVLNPFYSPTSTTPLSTYRPDSVWRATSTVDLVSLNITGPATSTFVILCGADDDGFISGTTKPSNLLNSEVIATGTMPVLENNMYTSVGTGGLSTGSTTKIMLMGDAPYITCIATSTPLRDTGWGHASYNNGVIGGDNTFDGTYKIRFYRNQY